MTWGYVVPAIRDFAQAEMFWGRNVNDSRPGGVYQVYMRPEDRMQGAHGLILERSADWFSVLWRNDERLRFWRDGRITTRVAGNNRGMAGALALRMGRSNVLIDDLHDVTLVRYGPDVAVAGLGAVTYPSQGDVDLRAIAVYRPTFHLPDAKAERAALKASGYPAFELWWRALDQMGVRDEVLRSASPMMSAAIPDALRSGDPTHYAPIMAWCMGRDDEKRGYGRLTPLGHLRRRLCKDVALRRVTGSPVMASKDFYKLLAQARHFTFDRD